jgi:hypothetical protein
MMTGEGWLKVMFYGMDTNGVNMAPIQNVKWYYVIFFCAFMVVATVFLLNLFVGVIIDNFNKIKD